MSWLQLAGWFQADEHKTKQSEQRALDCETGSFVWCSDFRSWRAFQCLRDETGRANGMQWPEFHKGHKRERFYRLASSQRPFCGAKCRSGQPCKARVCVRSNGTLARRCRMHGGTSTGPKTKAGRAAIAISNARRARV
jgi:hypothetical protein